MRSTAQETIHLTCSMRQAGQRATNLCGERVTSEAAAAWRAYARCTTCLRLNKVWEGRCNKFPFASQSKIPHLWCATMRWQGQAGPWPCSACVTDHVLEFQ